jgi:hypothetical protein
MRRMLMPRMRSRHQVRVRTSELKEANGIVAPTKKKVALLTSKSMIDEKLDSSIESVNQSSQAKAAPQAKACQKVDYRSSQRAIERTANRSSEPARVVTEAEKRARATYMATIDSRSMSALRLANFMS